MSTIHLNGRGGLGCLLVAWALLGAAPAHALFGDDEARKAIIELRQRVETHRQQAEVARQELEALQRATKDDQTAIRRSMVELAAQNDQLRREMATLRGQYEQLARDVAEWQRSQKDSQRGIDERLRQMEPASVTVDGVSFTASPTEVQAFDQAMASLRQAEFDAAAQALTAFVRRFPESGYLPSVFYWLGNAQYGQRAYRESLESHRRLVAGHANHPKVPEAMLGMANSHIELKDNRSARRVLEDLVRLHPQSEAAAAAKDRLARLR